MPKFISEFKEGEIVDFPTNRKYEFVRALKSGGTGKTILMQDTEYYGAAEPPVRCGESHLSGLTEPLRSL